MAMTRISQLVLFRKAYGIMLPFRNLRVGIGFTGIWMGYFDTIAM
jgi:hypothetical protein